jgi:hypothetical protein
MKVYWPRFIGMIMSFGFLIYVVHLVRRKRLREDYSIFWVLLGLCMLAFSIFKGFPIWLSNVLHFPAPIFTVFFFGMFLLLCICLYFSVKLTELQRKLNMLAQRYALERTDEVESKGGCSRSHEETTEPSISPD